MTEKWIQEAIKRPGSLKRWLKEHRSEIKRKLGEDPFTSDGRIRKSVLRKLKKNKKLLKELAGPHWKRIYRKINLALTLKKLAKHKKKGRKH